MKRPVKRWQAGTDISVDIENASLEDVHAHTELMNANIAELIMGLDDVTSAFSKDFDEMRSKTTMESIVGWFFWRQVGQHARGADALGVC